MNVLVTGNLGYLGGQVVPALRRHGHQVRGLDCGYFAGCLAVPADDAPTLRGDIRDMTAEVLRDVDVVVHLAALSNDPVGDLDPRWTREINVDATVRLADLARTAGVKRFVLASSCIMYGLTEDGLADESTPLDPQTAYARSKVDAEAALRQLADDDYSPVFLRNGTVYGASPRMRLDTVFNDFIASAVTTGTVVVRGDGEAWRPVVDIRDVAEAFAAAVGAPPENVHNQAVNIGAPHLNQRVLDLAHLAAACVPGASVRVLAEATADRRTYRAGFAKCARVFPDLDFRPVDVGGKELARDLGRLAASGALADADRFVRVRQLRRLVEAGLLDGALRWRTVR